MNTLQDGANQAKPHVLIVDDEAELCHMVAICLQQSGFRISSAGNAADAYSLLEQEQYDAIVSDVMMPGENGISFLGRAHQTWPDIPVILMTAHAQLKMAVDAIKNGAFDFVHKPFDFGYMCKIIERAVNYSKLQRMEKNCRAELEETVVSRTAELKDALVELDVARSALLKNFTEKNEFLSNVSHEMRTPMNGVVGGLSLLENEVSTAKGMEYLEIVRQSADNMVSLIDQLLTFGKGTGQKGNAACFDLINLATNLNAVVAEFQPDFAQKGLSLALRIAADIPPQIQTQKEHLNRLLGILLGNALKFTDMGAVTLDVIRDDLEGDGEMLHFIVTDSGIGIPKGMLERIFEPFVQGDGSYTRRHGGVGLGLAIAQQKALILNGRLLADHVPDGGSRFKFSMKVLEP
ncbi:MAG: response regulator [Pedobacter sp.]